MESAISKIKPVFFCKDLTITEFSLCLVAEYEHMQEPLSLLKMLAQSQQAVIEWKIVSSVNNLAEFPDMGSIPKELVSLGIRQYRQVIQKPYRIIYETFSDKVVVHAILDGRRDMQNLLMQRILRG
jgi:plasmid stabilization system protein ParE